MIEGKGLGGKKINRVNISLDNRYNKKLLRLATACNMPHTTLACLLVEISLDNSELVSKLQNEYGIHTAYKVVPVKNFATGDLEYILNERG